MNTALDWFRLIEAMAGVAGFSVMVFRLVGRWDLLSDLSRWVVALLGLANATIGLTAARSAQLSGPFNELGILGLIVNLGTVVIGLVWYRLLAPGESTHRKEPGT